MSEECQELKNIKYQTMLLNNNSKIISTKANSDNLDEFLKKEKAQNKNTSQEGNVSIKKKLRNRRKSNKEVGEYIDYEEID